MKELTKAEEQLMRHLWKLEKAFQKDIYEVFGDPKPAYTTISTVIRVLVKKKFIGFKTYGKTNEYYPLISKREYSKFHLKNLVKNFFNGSNASFASFFTENEDISISDLEEIKKMVEMKIEQRKEK